jgi:hypothetical protein
MKDPPLTGTIHFDAVARRIVALNDLRLIREQLMLTWNARGAADIAKIGTEVTAMMGPSTNRPVIKTLARGLRIPDSRVRC